MSADMQGGFIYILSYADKELTNSLVLPSDCWSNISVCFGLTGNMPHKYKYINFLRYQIANYFIEISRLNSHSWSFIWPIISPFTTLIYPILKTIVSRLFFRGVIYFGRRKESDILFLWKYETEDCLSRFYWLLECLFQCFGSQIINWLNITKIDVS